MKGEGEKKKEGLAPLSASYSPHVGMGRVIMRAKPWMAPDGRVGIDNIRGAGGKDA
jgi:hypothetical protein